MKRILALLLFAGLATALGAADLSGNGVLVTETRSARDFVGIDMRGAGELRVSRGSVFSVKLTLDSNLLKAYRTEVRDHVLLLCYDSAYSVWNSSKAKVEVTMPELTGLFLDGACAATIGPGFASPSLMLGLSGASTISAGVNVSSLTVDAFGSAHLELAGRADAVTAALSGACKLEGRALNSKRARLRLDGASHAALMVSEALDATASGASTLRYFGDPSVTIRKSGAARVDRG